MSKIVTAVCGGIGSGKSVVCALLRIMGYPVYDCDSEARRLMDADPIIKSEINARIDPQCVVGGVIDRSRLSEIVFADAGKLAALNSIVHTAVKRNLSHWVESLETERIFIETAILYQSGLDKMVDEVWEVTAPIDVRLLRVIQRNGLTREQVAARIQAQDSFVPESLHPRVFNIINDGVTPVLPQVEHMLG